MLWRIQDTTHLRPSTSKSNAKALIMDHLIVPIIRGAQVLLRMYSLDVPAAVIKLVATLQPDGSVKKERPRALPSGKSAVVELKLESKVVVESFQNYTCG